MLYWLSDFPGLPGRLQKFRLESGEPMPIFDTHAHYDSGSFNADREEILSALPAAGVGLVVNPGCDLETSRTAVALADRFPHVYAAVGVHPSDCAGWGDAEFEELEELSRHEKVVAIGEIGLDYYWPDNPPRDFQQQVFRRQIELALKRDLPIIVHDREAHQDSLNVVLEYPELRGVFHCFSGSPEMAEILIKRGWYLGIDGPITYKNARRAPEVAEVIPLDRIVVETDAPYLTPEPFRGKRNDSRYLPYVIEKMARWKGVTPEELTAITWENGKRLFGLE